MADECHSHRILGWLERMSQTTMQMQTPTRPRFPAPAATVAFLFCQDEK